MGVEKIAGRYRVERTVGRGGMGAVWLCTDEVLGREVAVKQVLSRSDGSARDHARALREARSLAALNHRNVVSVYDAVEDDDQLWLVMEYVPGRSLAALLAEEGSLSPEDTVRIGAQVADGLAAAHERGITHRDVKPANVLVTDSGVAKISDFGIARMLEDTRLTGSGMVTGTPGYFAPELARGEDPTPAADVWALGATLYAAVEGRALYPTQGNALAVLNEIASGSPPRPERAGFLTEPITRALDPDPHSRWSMPILAHVLSRLETKYARTHTRISTAAFPAGGTAGPTPEDAAAAGPTPEDAAAAGPTPEDAGTAGPTPEDAGAAGPTPEDAAAAASRSTGPRTAEQQVSTPPATRSPRRRHTRVLPVLVVVAALLIVGGVAFLLLHGAGGEGSGGQGGAATGARNSGTGSGSSGGGSSGSSSSGGGSGGTSVTGGGAEQFVDHYYAALPGDTKAGWSSLTTGFQDQIGGYGSYRGFWKTISDVAVTGTKPAGPDAVDVFLRYTKDDGSKEGETRRLYLQHTGSGYLISGDKVIG